MVKSAQIQKLNVELLRIVSMICIVLSHYANHGELAELPMSVNHLFGLILRTGGKIGVIVFVFIHTYLFIAAGI